MDCGSVLVVDEDVHFRRFGSTPTSSSRACVDSSAARRSGSPPPNTERALRFNQARTAGPRASSSGARARPDSGDALHQPQDRLDARPAHPFEARRPLSRGSRRARVSARARPRQLCSGADPRVVPKAASGCGATAGAFTAWSERPATSPFVRQLPATPVFVSLAVGSRS